MAPTWTIGKLRSTQGLEEPLAASAPHRTHTHTLSPHARTLHPNLWPSSHFAKFTRDCGLLDAKLTPTEADIIFSYAKAKGERRINYKQFCEAVQRMAAVKIMPVEDLKKQILAAGGPLLDHVHLPSTAETVFEKLTSPVSFTGSHKKRFSEDGRGKGREGRVDEQDAIHDIRTVLRPNVALGGTLLASAHADRTRELTGGSLSPAKAVQLNRGLGGSGGRGSSSFVGGGGGGGYSGNAAEYSAKLSEQPSYTAATGNASRRGGGSATTPTSELRQVEIDSAELEKIFGAYCAFGSTSHLNKEMDGARFAKLCRENGIMDGHLVTPAHVDLAFAKAIERARVAQKTAAAARPKQSFVRPVRCLAYKDFQQALALLAPMRHPDKVVAPTDDGSHIVPALQATVESIILTGGPAFNNVQLPQVEPHSVFGKLTDAGPLPATAKGGLGSSR